MSDKYKEIGEILAAARRDQNKTLKNASESTKIMENYLVALEAGNPDKLPSVAYFHLFARSYAQYLGIDATVFDEIEEKDLVSAASSSDDGISAPFDEDAAKTASKVQAKKFGRSLIYLATIIIVIFLAFILYNQFFVKNNNGSLLEDLTGTHMTDEQSSADEQQGRAELIIPETPYQSPGKLKMYMRVKQDVWAMLMRDGDTVLNRRLNAGDERYWEADYRYQLTLGISTAVDLYVNDLKLAPLTDQPRTISGLEINQVNYRDFLPVSDENETISTPAQAAQTGDATSDNVDNPPQGRQAVDTMNLTGEEPTDGH